MILTDGNTHIELPNDLLWADELWTPVEQSVDHSVTGALFIEPWEKQAGRPITLQPPAQDMAFLNPPVTREKVMQIRAWAATPGQQLTLTLEDNSSYPVIFRHPNPVEAEPVKGHTRRHNNEIWRLTIRLMEMN